MILRRWLVRASSNIIDTEKGSEQTICPVPSSSASVVGHSIIRHIVFMVEAYEAIHRGAVAGHVVGLDNTAVVCHCEIMDPFLVD